MVELSLEPMTLDLCHKYFKYFENDCAVYLDTERFKSYVYNVEKVNIYFDSQNTDDRIVFMIMRDGEPIGEVKLKDIDEIKKECSLGIHLQNESVKGQGIGTIAEKMALDYAFENLDMTKVNADVLHKNKRSQHVLEKVGFRFIREDDTFKYYVIER
uniref:GNAT family N-acetyltransferase n=1 Tax=Acetatifactor sp. TaxID=1872090 RepID=UPI0040575A10